MSVSVFPSASGGGGSGGGFNNFAISLGDYSDNTTVLSQEYPSGSYTITTEPSDTTLDVYILSSGGELVGYTNTLVLKATAAFIAVIIIGGQADLKLSFVFGGETGEPTSAGQNPNAGAYITSTNPTDLPDINDTTTVTGGNFATDVEMNFVSGEITLAAKSITRASSIELVIGRPDDLDAALDPWSMQVANPGVPVPSGSNANKTEVTAGATPVWTTTSPLPAGQLGQAFTKTLQATDADPGSSISYTITSGSFPGLTLDSSTGVLSGTPTANATATVTATDLGGNSNLREFSTAFVTATGGNMSTAGGYTYHTFENPGTLTMYGTVAVESLIVAAGGSSPNQNGGGGGGGGYLAQTPTLDAGDYVIAVGYSVSNANGQNSSFNGSTAIGGGKGNSYNSSNGSSGGSGGGNGGGGSARAGTSGQGNAGGGSQGAPAASGGGGGAGSAGSPGSPNTNAHGGHGGNGLQWLNGTYYSAGGGGGNGYNGQVANGGQGMGNRGSGGGSNAQGSPGIVIVRYPS